MASSSLSPPPPPPTSSIPQKPVLKRPTLAAIGIPTGTTGGEASGRIGFVTNKESDTVWQIFELPDPNSESREAGA